jgi:hypothetical protein
MSPGSHCYFDHYQGDPANEPLAIGGLYHRAEGLQLRAHSRRAEPEEAKYILGAQGNVWTEYILTPEHVEYMAVPRMLALAEVLWTPKEKERGGLHQSFGARVPEAGCDEGELREQELVPGAVQAGARRCARHSQIKTCVRPYPAKLGTRTPIRPACSTM